MILRRPIRRKPPLAWVKPVSKSGHHGRAVIMGVAVTIFVIQHLYLVAQLSYQQAAKEEEYYYLQRNDRRFRQGYQQQQGVLILPNKNGALLYRDMKQAALKFNRPAIAKVLLEHEEFDVAMPLSSSSSSSSHSSSSNKTLTLEDFPELAYDNDQQQQDDYENSDHTTDNQHDNEQKNNDNSSSSRRKEILDILQKAGITVDEHVLHRLPQWQDVVNLYGNKPIVVGMETCEAFRASVPAEDRFVGVGGQQNAGTTVLSQLLVNNLRIPQNYQVSFGMTFQLPWNKHGWLDMRGKLQEYSPYYEKIVLPVIVIRDPFFWMHSMCESPYDMLWENHNASSTGSTGVAPHCPNLAQPHKSQSGKTAALLQETDGEPVRVSWAHAFHREWHSLAHVWSEWYKEYLEQADFPRLIVRHEDLLFHAPAVLDKVRECVGAKWRHKEFVYITEPVKTTKYFTDFKAQSGMVSAMIRFGQDKTGRHRIRNMTQADLLYARTYLDETLMQTFGYQWPSSIKDLH